MSTSPCPIAILNLEIETEKPPKAGAFSFVLNILEATLLE
jgi:hypothetical protein